MRWGAQPQGEALLLAVLLMNGFPSRTFFLTLYLKVFAAVTLDYN